jgi:pimeloyl-ACP methyl ester carboxylesterase
MAKLNYKTFGEGDPLIIMHGLMGMLDNWQGLAKKYAEDFEVFILDARNHGRSPWENELSYEVMMYDLLEFCHEHSLSNFHLLGHSMGGKTAMKFAINFADFIDKLIVADIGPKAYPVHHQKILEGLSALDFSTIVSRGEADKILAEYVPDIGVRSFLMKSVYWAEKGQLGLRFNLETIKGNIEKMGSPIDDGNFTKSTLFIRGNQSDYVLDKDIPTIESQFTDASFYTIENAGHWLHAEKPEEFIRATKDFLLD